jgi:ankyrin repeat protein
MILALLAGKPTIDCLYNGMTPLMMAVAMNRLAAARLLLNAGANPSLTTNHPSDQFTNISPFTQAILYGQTEIALLLIKYGVNIEGKHMFCMPKRMWETPLTLSAIRNGVGVCRVLLDAGANINAQSSNGNTVLTRAAFYGNTDMVKLLLQKKADVEKRTEAKWAALTGAVNQGHLEIVKVLVDYGAVGDPKPYWSWKRFPFNKTIYRQIPRRRL